jgi:hypothetical protein
MASGERLPCPCPARCGVESIHAQKFESVPCVDETTHPFLVVGTDLADHHVETNLVFDLLAFLFAAGDHSERLKVERAVDTEALPVLVLVVLVLHVLHGIQCFAPKHFERDVLPIALAHQKRGGVDQGDAETVQQTSLRINVQVNSADVIRLDAHVVNLDC